MKKTGIIILLYFISIIIPNFVVARELNVRWVDGLIPGGNIAHDSLTCLASGNETALEKDRTEDPQDVVFSNDGLTVFTVNITTTNMDSNTLSMNKVSEAFKVSTDKMTAQDATCADIDGSNPRTVSSTAIDDELENLTIRDDGKISIKKISKF